MSWLIHKYKFLVICGIQFSLKSDVFYLLEGVDIADCYSREHHGVEANRERHTDTIGQVCLNDNPPLPEYEGCKNQSQYEPHDPLLWSFRNNALWPMSISIVAKPDQQLLVGVTGALLHAVQGPCEIQLSPLYHHLQESQTLQSKLELTSEYLTSVLFPFPIPFSFLVPSSLPITLTHGWVFIYGPAAIP